MSIWFLDSELLTCFQMVLNFSKFLKLSSNLQKLNLKGKSQFTCSYIGASKFYLFKISSRKYFSFTPKFCTFKNFPLYGTYNV